MDYLVDKPLSYICIIKMYHLFSYNISDIFYKSDIFNTSILPKLYIYICIHFTSRYHVKKGPNNVLD